MAGKRERERDSHFTWGQDPSDGVLRQRLERLHVALSKVKGSGLGILPLLSGPRRVEGHLGQNFQYKFPKCMS